MLRRLSSGMTNETRPLLLVTSVLKYNHSPEGGWVMMWRSICRGAFYKHSAKSAHTVIAVRLRARVSDAGTATSSPSPQPESPCPEGRTWSGQSRPAGCLLWTLRHSCDGLQSRSVNPENKQWALTACYSVPSGLGRQDTNPDLHMSPLAEPLFTRFRRGELRHFFPIQLQDAGVFVPHHLQEGISGLFRPGSCI